MKVGTSLTSIQLRKLLCREIFKTGLAIAHQRRRWYGKTFQQIGRNNWLGRL
jgi:hypothetical protein